MNALSVWDHGHNQRNNAISAVGDQWWLATSLLELLGPVKGWNKHGWQATHGLERCCKKGGLVVVVVVGLQGMWRGKDSIVFFGGDPGYDLAC